MYSSKPILDTEKDKCPLNKNVKKVVEYPLFESNGYHRKASIQGLVTGGDVEVKIEYSNHSRLPFKELITLTFSDNVEILQDLPPLPISRQLRFTVTNLTSNIVEGLIVPCFV